MGCSQSSPETAVQSGKPATPVEAPESALVEVELKKHRPECNGMFWRSDPTGATPLESNENWPKDNALLRGRVVHDSDGDKWLLCSQVKQKGSSRWLDAPKGAAMPFKYYDHYYLELRFVGETPDN